MAYNPFNIFRRNQKAIFAVVTVVIMFMFVLSSGMTGKADFFNWLPEWIHGKTKKSDVLATLDGDKIRKHDLDPIRFQRIVANKFLAMASGNAAENCQKTMIELRTQATPGLLEKIMQAQQLEQYGIEPGSAARLMQAILDNPQSKQADKDLIRMMRVLSDFMQAQRRFAQTGSYLNLSPNYPGNDRDVIDFMLWDRKAKQLGIEFTAEDVKKTLMQKEFLGLFKDDPQVRRALTEEYKERYSDDLAFRAIATEFRVRAVQNAILGIATRSDNTLTALPIFTPPYELFDYYRDQTSPTTYQLLRVPVESFIPLVTEVPTDGELERLFNERKNYEPDPSREEPGFMQPRRVKVEWISATGDEPYYKKLASEYLTKGPIALALVPPALGTWSTMTVAPLGTTDPLLRERYKSRVDLFKSKIEFGWTGPTTFVMPYDILDTSVVKPQNLAAAAGGAAGAVGFGNPFFSPASFLYTASVAAEQRARIKAAMPLVLGAVPGPGMFATLMGGEAAFRKKIPEPLPLEAYKPELLKELGETKARELAVNDLKKLDESIRKLTETGKARENAAKDLIADFIKTRGVKSGASTELRGEFTIGDDPGLAPLKALLDKDKDVHSARGSGPVQFGTKFFWNSETGRREQTTGNYKPEFYPERAAENALTINKTDPVFLTWRTADEKATQLSFTAAKPLVLAAWKRAKARGLALAEAERLANELRAKPPTESDFPIISGMADMEAQLKAKSTDPKAKERVKSFPIANVAPKAIGSDPMGRGLGLVPFRIAPSNEIPYPTAEMNKKLIDERTKPVKTVFVQADQPKDSYYVIALTRRDERQPYEFSNHAYSQLGSLGEQIRGAQQNEAFVKARDSILTLLKKEFKYVETEEQKKKLDEKKSGSFDE